MGKLVQRVKELEDEVSYLRAELESDALTGLGNRKLYERLVEDRMPWVVVADIDNFKQAQDCHPDGHDHGDKILREFGRFLMRNTRQGGETVLVRMGGDEFLVGCSEKAIARSVRDRIRKWASRLSPLVGASAGLGVSYQAADAAQGINKEKRKNAQENSEEDQPDSVGDGGGGEQGGEDEDLEGCLDDPEGWLADAPDRPLRDDQALGPGAGLPSAQAALRGSSGA